MEEQETNKDKGSLLKRKDYLGVDQNAHSHPNRTYYYRKHVDLEEVIKTCSKKLQVTIFIFFCRNKTVVIIFRLILIILKRCISEGHLILNIEPVQNYFKVLIQKV